MRIGLQSWMLRAFVLAWILFGCTTGSQAQKKSTKADLFVGYSHLGSKTFYREAGGLSGWEGALNIQKGRFLGIEGDLAHYGMGAKDTVPRTTVFMVGPRLTASLTGLTGIHLFVHGLIGGEHSRSKDGKLSGGTMTVAFGGGGDVRIAPFLSWRVSADYLAAPTSSPSSGSHQRISTGVVVRF